MVVPLYLTVFLCLGILLVTPLSKNFSVDSNVLYFMFMYLQCRLATFLQLNAYIKCYLFKLRKRNSMEDWGNAASF